MKLESRRCAELVHGMLRDELRASTYVALMVGFIVALLAIALGAFFGIAAFDDLLPIKVLQLVFFSLVFGTLGFVLACVWPLRPRYRRESVHQVVALTRQSWQFRGDERMRIEDLASRFDEPPGAPGSTYDESLLTEVGHLAWRCRVQRVFLRAAILMALGTLGVGVAVIIVRQWL